VTIEDLPGDAMSLLEGYREGATAEEELESLQVASGAVAFIYFTGQLYRFDEFRRHKTANQSRVTPLSQVADYLERSRMSIASPEEREVLHFIIDALDFIGVSGQEQGLEEYIEHWRSETLPPVIAAFKTPEEAEAWLESQPVPPYGARVLIGDEYSSVTRTRERREPGFRPMPTVEEFIGDHSFEGLPPATAAFDTRQEAEAWLMNNPEPPRHAFIKIGGEYYLAAYQKSVSHRALYPFTRADEWLKRLREALNPLSQ
jgi:hypothetical protein